MKTQSTQRKNLTQWQRTMLALERAGAVRKDGKSTAVELGIETDHERIEDARTEARLDAQAEYEDQREYEFAGEQETDAERNQ